MTKTLLCKIDRCARTPLAEQISNGIISAIDSGALQPGARLPSWLDLAAQLGVARGTVRSAYEKLTDAQLIVSSKSAGTRVAGRITRAELLPETDADPDSTIAMYRALTFGPATFRMGIPAHDAFPAKLMARIRAQAVRAETTSPAIYPDPQGEPELRREIAAHLAIARGVECSPSQIFITSGFHGGLGLTLRALGLEGHRAWVESPGFPFTRRGLELAKLSLTPVPIDANGMDVAYGIEHAPDAALAVVTPGQQAPLGSTMSMERRLQLLDWAARTGAWIIEDDYLSELQLGSRAAPALASIDRTGRVIHIGTFSKTISPTLRLGFLVAPTLLAAQISETAACLAAPPGPSVQHATAEFMRDGHYLRHLRRMKRLLSTRQEKLSACLAARGYDARTAGIALLLELPNGTSDTTIAKDARAFGLSPMPLSPWYLTSPAPRSGLLLGAATVHERSLDTCCDRLCRIIDRFV
jgi:GntR family transcriptional regulator/MocR family aminotransferase